MEAYNKKIRGMILDLDSKQHYDEPRMMFHESVHTPRTQILAGGNDMSGGGFILPGQNDLKADIVGPTPKKSSKRKTAPKTASKPVSKRGLLIRKIMQDQGMTLPQASSFIKQNQVK